MASLTEAECRYVEQTLSSARELLRQSQRLKKQLVENLDKKEEVGRSLKKESISWESRKTPQQVDLFRIPHQCILLSMYDFIALLQGCTLLKASPATTLESPFDFISTSD